jgi:hypothetical protein
MIDLAADLDDLGWEQALESAIRRRLTTIGDIERAVPALGAARIAGTARIRRALGCGRQAQHRQKAFSKR